MFTDREKLKITLDALKGILDHERELKGRGGIGAQRYDDTVCMAAYAAVNSCGYLDKDTSDLPDYEPCPPDEQPPAPPDENTFVGRYGEWTTFNELPERCVFQDETGEYWAKTGNGSLVQMPKGFTAQYCHIDKVRQIHLPAPSKPEPTLEERAWALLEDIANRGGGWKKAEALLAEKQAQETAKP